MKNKFLEKEDIQKKLKVEVVKVVRLTMFCGSEPWTLSDKENTGVDVMESRLL